MLKKNIPNNLPAVLKHEGIALAIISRDEGVGFAIGRVVLLIGKLNDFVNASRKMTEDQILLTAELILEEYYYMKLHEIEFVFRNAMKGKYGKLYETLDGFKIMEWFLDYSAERAEYVYTDELRKHDQIKEIRN